MTAVMLDVRCSLCNKLVGGLDRSERFYVRFFCPNCGMEIFLMKPPGSTRRTASVSYPDKMGQEINELARVIGKRA